MPIKNKSILIFHRVYKNSRARTSGTRKPTKYSTNTTQKIYYNADNPQLSYGNNSYSISIKQPSGSTMGSMVGQN